MAAFGVTNNAFGAAGGAPSLAGNVAPSSSGSGIGVGNAGTGAQGSSTRGLTLFPLGALFYHKLTNVAYHRQKLRRIKYDDISSLFYDRKVGEYMLNVFSVPSKNENDRKMVERGEVPGVSDDLRRHAELRAGILAFSDQYEMNELICLDYVVAIFRNPGLLRELERGDTTKGGNYYDLNDHNKVIQAAMDLYVYERQAVLKSLLLLLKLAYMSSDSASADKEQETVASVIASEHDGNAREEDVILEMCKHLIGTKELGSRLIGTAAKLYGKAKRRHGSSDHDSHGEGGGSGAGRGFLGPGINSLVDTAAGGSSGGVDSLSSGGNLSAGLNGPNGGSGSNYLTSRGTILRQFEELQTVGEALFYCSAVLLPPVEFVGKLQVLCSGVAQELMKEDDGVYGDGGDYGAGEDYSSAAKFYQLYRSCLQSFVISLQLAHVQAVKLLAINPREVSLETILDLIPVEFRREMLETRARPLRWGDGVLLFSFVHVLARRGGLEDGPYAAEEGEHNVFGYGRAASIDSSGGSAEDSESWSKHALIFKGILAWVHLSRSFSFLRLGVLPVLQAACKSSLSAGTDAAMVVADATGEAGSGVSQAGAATLETEFSTGTDLGNTRLSFNIIPEARYVNNTAGDLFSVLMTALEVTVDVFSSEEMVEFHTNWFDISNLFAAALAVYPPLSSKLILNEDSMSFKPAVFSCLQYSSQDSKAIVPALYLLAGISMGDEAALETVYRFLDKAGSAGGSSDVSQQAWGDSSGLGSSTMGTGMGMGTRGRASATSGPEFIPNMSLNHFMASIAECARICSGGASPDGPPSGASEGGASSTGSILKDNHEKVLMAILTLLQALCRSTSVCELFIRDYRPLETLFRLVCGPISVSLKGSIFRTLAVIANATVHSGVLPSSSSSSSSSSSVPTAGAGGSSIYGSAGAPSSMASNSANVYEGSSLTVHQEIWRLVEAHRLLPAPHEESAGAAGSMMTGGRGLASGVGTSTSNYGAGAGAGSDATAGAGAGAGGMSRGGGYGASYGSMSSGGMSMSMGMGTDTRGSYGGNIGAGTASGGGSGAYLASASAAGNRGSRGGQRGGYGVAGAGDEEDLPMSYIQGLRLELEDSESKLGVYAITDSFLALLEALLTGACTTTAQGSTRPAHDELGLSIRVPGILHYLEYVVCDVLLTIPERFFINGPHGEGQRWRLLYRGFRVLSAALSSYPVHLLPALLAKLATSGADGAVSGRGSGGSGAGDVAPPSVSMTAGQVTAAGGTPTALSLSPEEQETLAYLNRDFERLKYMASTATSGGGKSKRGSGGPSSAGLYVMTLLLAWESPLRSLLLQVLRTGASEELEVARKRNIHASVVQASKMCANLGSSGRHLDARLAYSGVQGQSGVDGFFWRAKSVAAATELLHELSLRERAFFQSVTSAVGAPKVGLLRVVNHGNTYAYSAVTIKPLAESLLTHKHALGSLVATSSITGLLVEEGGMYSPKEEVPSLVEASVALSSPSTMAGGGGSSPGAYAGGSGAVSAMASTVLVKALHDCSLAQAEEYLERLLTHPGNAAGDVPPSSVSPYPSTSSSLLSGSYTQSGPPTSVAGAEWTLTGLQRCLLDTLRASLVDPTTHPRSCEQMCRQVVALGGDLPAFIETDAGDSDDTESDAGNGAPASSGSGSSDKGAAGTAAAKKKDGAKVATALAGARAGVGAGEQASAVVLRLILSCLHGGKLSLGHVLLGLTPAMDATYGDRWDLHLGASFSSTGGWIPPDRHSAAMHVPETVLGQIMLLLEDSGDIIQSQPYLAALCYELIYTLCRQKITSSVVLSFLRVHSVAAGGRRLKFIPYVVKQVLSSLRQHPVYWSNSGPHQDSPGLGLGLVGVSEAEVDENEDGDTSASASAAALCAAWALKILSLEFRAVEALISSDRSILTTDLQELLSLYVDIIEVQPDAPEEESHSFVGLTELLVAAVNASNVSTRGLALSDSVSVRVEEDDGYYDQSGAAAAEPGGVPSFNLGMGADADTSSVRGGDGGGGSRGSESIISARAGDVLANPFIASCVSKAAVPYSVGSSISGSSGRGGGRRSYNPPSSSSSFSSSSLLTNSSNVDKNVATGDAAMLGETKAIAASGSGGGGKNTGAYGFSIVDKALFSSVFWAGAGANGSGGAGAGAGAGAGSSPRMSERVLANSSSASAIDAMPLSVQHSLCMEALTLLNRRRRNLASAVHLLEAWEGCVAVLISMLGRWLARPSMLTQDGTGTMSIPLPSFTMAANSDNEGKARPSGSVLLYNREANLRHYLRYVAGPLLDIYETHVDSVDSAVAELLASSVFTVLSGERNLSSAHKYLPALGSASAARPPTSLLGKRKQGQGQGLGLTNDAYFRSGAGAGGGAGSYRGVDNSRNVTTGTGTGTGTGLGSDNIVPVSIRLPPCILEKLLVSALSLSRAPIRPIQAATRLRGLAFASVSAYLQPYLPLPAPFNRAGSGADVGVSPAAAAAAAAAATAAAVPLYGVYSDEEASFSAQWEAPGKVRALLAANMTALTDCISREACDGPLIWNLSALSCLGRVCALVDGDALAAAAKVLHSTGRLAQLVRASGMLTDAVGRDNSASATAAGIMRGGDGSDGGSSNTPGIHRTGSGSGSSEMRCAVLSLCCHLASTPEGYMAVTEACGRDLCFPNLSSLFRSCGLPSSYRGLAAAGVVRRAYGDVVEDPPAGLAWLTQVTPLLNTLLALSLSPSSSSIRAQEGCSRFVCENAQALSALIASPWPAVAGIVHSSTLHDRSAASGGGGGDTGARGPFSGDDASPTSIKRHPTKRVLPSTEQYETACSQVEACARVTSALKVVSASLTTHSLQKELSLRGLSAAAAEINEPAAFEHANSSVGTGAVGAGAGAGAGRSRAGLARQEETLQLLSSSRRHVHAMVSALLGADRGGSGFIRGAGNSNDFDELSSDVMPLGGASGSDGASTTPVGVVVDLLQILSRALDCSRLTHNANAGYTATATATASGASGVGEGIGGDGYPDGVRRSANTGDHGWSTYHHKILTSVLTTLANLSVVIRNMNTAHATHQRLSALAVGTIAERIPGANSKPGSGGSGDTDREVSRRSGSTYNSNITSSQRRGSDKDGNGGSSQSNSNVSTGGLFGFDLLFQFGAGAPATALPEVTIKSKSSDSGSAGSGVSGGVSTRFASGSSGGSTSGDAEEQRERILRLGNAINAEFLGLKFPLDRVLSLFLVLASFEPLYMSHSPEQGSRGGQEQVMMGGGARGGGDGDAGQSHHHYHYHSDERSANAAGAGVGAGGAEAIGDHSRTGADLLQGCLVGYSTTVVHALQNLIMVVYSEVLAVSQKAAGMAVDDRNLGQYICDHDGRVLLTAKEMSMLVRVVHSARACFVHLRRQGPGHVPGGGGQQFPLPSGQTTQSTGDAGLGDASNTNATAMSVMMRNRLGVGAGSHVYSSAVGMPMGGGQGQGYFPSAVVPSDDGSLQVVAEIEKILSQLRALQ